MTAIPFKQIQELALLEGLNVVGALTLREAESQLQRAVPHLARWQQTGNAAEMSYMLRGVELFSTLKTVLPDAASVLTFMFPYANSKFSLPEERGFARVARYAWGQDYHQLLKRKLESFVISLSTQFGEIRARAFSDAVPILERTLAEGAGFGFVGRNSLLIRRGIGSFTFLAEIVCNREIEPGTFAVEARGPGSGCGSCQRCLSSCPTQALRGNGVLDASRCISYLNIEKRSAFTDWESKAIGDWIFGCDLCQEVCPFNHAPKSEHMFPEFSPEHGSGCYLRLLEILQISSNREFKARFAGSAIMRASRSGLVRNACAIAANQNYLEAVPLLERLVSDSELPVRIEARRSLARFVPVLDGREFMRVKAILRNLVEYKPDSVVI